MKFYFKSQKKTGEIVEGFTEAEDRFALARDIRGRGDMPLVARATDEKKTTANSVLHFNFTARIKLEDKILFTRNLSGMLSAGLSLARALSILEKQTNNIKFKGVITALIADINKGTTFSESLQKFPKVFPTIFVSMARAGEESGSLAKSLLQVGSNLEKSYALKRKIKGAMTYPLVILIAMLVIGILMFIFVVPTLIQTFKDLGGDLPASTKFIIFLSDTISGHPLTLVGVIGALVVGGMFLMRIPVVNKGMDWLIVRLPAIGLIAQEVNTARTARTLSSLLDAGVSMTRCLEITRDVLQNAFYKEVITEAIASVQKGTALSASFKAHTEIYPVMMGEMVEVGEETGKVASMLNDIATFYEEEVDAKTKNLSTIVEPVLMIIIGAAVGFFAISIIQPLYSIGGAIT